jgi:hypothetical protein
MKFELGELLDSVRLYFPYTVVFVELSCPFPASVELSCPFLRTIAVDIK